MQYTANQVAAVTPSHRNTLPQSTADGRHPTVGTAREHFLPIRRAELVAALCAELGEPAEPGSAAGDFARFCDLVSATFHYEYHAWLEELKNAYAPFDPDADTSPPRESSGDRRESAESFFDHCRALLERANYRRLSIEELRSTVTVASDWGMRLDVDFEAFERLDVYCRGNAIERRRKRSPATLYREVEIDVPVYKRLVVLFQLHPRRAAVSHLAGVAKADAGIYLKMFKDIPRADVNTLLPAARFRMTLLDRGKIVLPTLSGLAVTLFKIIKGGIIFAVSSFWGLIALLGFIATTVGYGVNSFFGYVRTKEKYQFSLTQNLYYQNLDNNAGVFFRLLDEAEEQECRETILSYFLLWQRAGDQGWTLDELDAEAEEFLRRRLDREVDFEAHDAVAKMLRLELASRSPDNRLVAVPLRRALERLDEAWDGFFSR